MHASKKNVSNFIDLTDVGTGLDHTIEYKPVKKEKKRHRNRQNRKRKKVRKTRWCTIRTPKHRATGYSLFIDSGWPKKAKKRAYFSIHMYVCQESRNYRSFTLFVWLDVIPASTWFWHIEQRLNLLHVHPNRSSHPTPTTDRHCPHGPTVPDTMGT